MTRRAILVDLDRCIGCYGCEIACKNENGLGLGERWNKVIQVGPNGTFPDIEMYFLPVMCQQCKESPCTHVCPTGASYRDENNVVLIDKSKCIGCKYCMMACPYDVRSWNETERVVEKCTLCQHLDEPACVTNCAVGARYYVDLDENSEAYQKLLSEFDSSDVHHLTDVGNEPSTAYLLSSKYANWIESEELASTNPEWTNSPWKKVQ
jgi:Fe-S-cluster-containing dehydrogenase component